MDKLRQTINSGKTENSSKDHKSDLLNSDLLNKKTGRVLYDYMVMFILMVYPVFYVLFTFFPLVFDFHKIDFILFWLMPVAPLVALLSLGLVQFFRHWIVIVIMALTNIILPFCFFYWVSQQ